MPDLAQVLALAETMRDRIAAPISRRNYSTDELLDDLREIIRLLNEND